jgi:hypothetical protein
MAQEKTSLPALTYLRAGGWLTGVLILLMPISLIFFLAGQMAYGQVKGKFEAYEQIPEISRLADLEVVPAGQVVLVRGELAGTGLIVFREGPAAGREVRFQEAFQQQFPEFSLILADGTLTVLPSLTREAVIQQPLHTVTEGDRERAGFRAGDQVTVQGQWQPGQRPLLQEVTGITGLDKQALMAEWQTAFRWVTWTRNGLGLLTLVSVGLLLVQVRRARRARSMETDTWTTQTNETMPIA